MQGKPVDIGGYYLVDAEEGEAVMRPSADAERGAGGGRQLTAAFAWPS